MSAAPTRDGRNGAAGARVTAIGTAVPEHVLEQPKVARHVAAVFGPRTPAFAKLEGIYPNAGIDRRHSCMPLSWYGETIGWRARNALFMRHAVALLESAATACLARARLPADAIDAIVTVTSTGIATPSLDAHLMERLAFRRDVARSPLFGLGCAGGALGLARAATLAEGSGCARVLLLVVELCALTFRPADTSKSNIVATALFGDGAAAVLVSTNPADSGVEVVGAGEHTWPNSLDVMGWEVADDGLGVVFSRDIPTIIRQDYPQALDAFLARHAMTRNDVAGFALHPGGEKVIRALEDVFGRPAGALREPREVLRRFGNMSSVTVLFVLETILAAAPSGPVLVSSLGPGFSAAFVLLQDRRQERRAA